VAVATPLSAKTAVDLMREVSRRDMPAAEGGRLRTDGRRMGNRERLARGCAGGSILVRIETPKGWV
jgi:hypothetical protein